MNEEQMKEICKAYFEGEPLVKIADTENLEDEQVAEAIKWGRKTGYLNDLKTGRNKEE